MITANGHIITHNENKENYCLCGFIYQSYYLPIETQTSKCAACVREYNKIFTKSRKNLKFMYNGWYLTAAKQNRSYWLIHPTTREKLEVSATIRNLLFGQGYIVKYENNGLKYKLTKKGTDYVKEYYRL